MNSNNYYAYMIFSAFGSGGAKKDKAVSGEEFTIEAALNTDGFLDFLAKKGDIEPTEDNKEQIKQEFRVFNAKKETSTLLRSIYRESIKTDVGIELTKDDFDAIDATMEGLAQDNPEMVLELLAQAKEFVDIPKRIKEKETEIKKIKDEQKHFSERDKTLNEVIAVRRMSTIKKVPGLGWFFRTDAEKKIWKNRLFNKQTLLAHADERKRVAEKDFEATYQGVLARAEKIQNAEEAISMIREAASGLRRQILGELESTETILTAVRQKLKRRVIDLAGKGTLDDLLKAQAEFEKMRQDPDVVTFDYAPEGDDMDESQEELDRQIAVAMQVELFGAIEAFVPGDSPLKSLQAKLKKYFEKSKLGSRNEADTKALFREILEKKMDELDAVGDEVSTRKKLLLKYVVSTIK